MSDLPTIKYNSNDDAPDGLQVTWAANAGITAFISSWWGAGGSPDKNFGKLLAHSATLQQATGQHFASAIYFEDDSNNMNSESKIVDGLRYIIATYGNNSNYSHWQGKPALFITN